MTERKRRRKVSAEITLGHLIQLAQKLGISMTEDEAIAFLNQNGHAYAMWTHMMQAGEAYLQSTLRRETLHATQALPKANSPRNRLTA